MDYEAEFQQYFATVKKDPASYAAFMADPEAALKKLGIPILSVEQARVQSKEPRSPALDDTSYQGWVHWHMWGCYIGFNEPLTKEVMLGNMIDAAANAALVTACAEATGAGVAAVLAAGIIIVGGLKCEMIQKVDSGNGICFLCSWGQWAGLIATVPAGPVAVSVALEVFFWPESN